MDQVRFEQLPAGDKRTVVAVAHHLIERVGGYYGTPSDAVTDAMSLVKDLGLVLNLERWADTVLDLTEPSLADALACAYQSRSIPHRL